MSRSVWRCLPMMNAFIYSLVLPFEDCNAEENPMTIAFTPLHKNRLYKDESRTNWELYSHLFKLPFLQCAPPPPPPPWEGDDDKVIMLH